MSQARPSQRAAYREATRANILVVARRLFLAHGVDEVPLEAIASEAGVSRATVYQHFAGKPPLLEALLAEDWEKQAVLFARLGDGIAPPDAETLAAWLRRVVEGMRRASGSFALHRAALGQNAELADPHRVHRQRLAGLLRESLRLGESTRERIESGMIVAEIEHLATAALGEWNAAETAIAIEIMTRRMAVLNEPASESR